MKPDPKSVSEITTKSTQQQDVSNRNQQDKTESSDDSMLIRCVCKTPCFDIKTLCIR